jgi:hypothetical protein
MSEEIPNKKVEQGEGEKTKREEILAELSSKEQYYLEQERLFIGNYPTIEVEQFTPEQCTEKIKELEALYTNFEQTHNLDVLNAIQVHTPEEAYANTVREAAKKDLPAIASLKILLDKQSQIPKEAIQKLHTRYQLIQAAVGVLNNGQLDHSIR